VTERVTRIDSGSMAAILLDVDGVLEVSGEPIPGAADGINRLREKGHRLRFVTNNTTHARSALADELRGLGVELEDDELQTTTIAAARALAGKRVLALTMQAIVGDLEGIELVGEGADAVLLGGADETEETGRVFSYMNLARAFAELQAGAELYCLHKNRWWQTLRGPLLDAGAFVAGLEYAADVEAIVLGKPSVAYFEAALEALDADPQLTWMVGDDLESDIAGAQKFGMRTVLVRTGKFRPDDLERSQVVPDMVLSSIALLPDWLERAL
jgi:HAD superfamily hydrolase (TIGR01458 family)